MTEHEFDLCPNCGEYAQFGLRCHPKFAVCYEGSTSEGPDMLMAYSHTQEQNDTLAAFIGSNVIYKQRWDHEQKKWLVQVSDRGAQMSKSMSLDHTLYLAKLVHARKTLIKRRDHLDPGKTRDFYQDRVVQLTDEIYKIESDWGGH